MCPDGIRFPQGAGICECCEDRHLEGEGPPEGGTIGHTIKVLRNIFRKMVWAEDGVLWCVAECLHEWSEPKPCSAGRPRGRKRSTACASDQLQVENSLRNKRKFQKRVQGLIKDPDDDDASRDDAATDECPGEGETSRGSGECRAGAKCEPETGGEAGLTSKPEGKIRNVKAADDE